MGMLSLVETVRASRGATGNRLRMIVSPAALAAVLAAAFALTRLRKSSRLRWEGRG